MITLQQFMELTSFRITEGSDYCWGCYGSNAHCLDSWNGEHEGHSLSIIFDTKTQEVYEVQAHDYANSRAYRLINPDYKADFDYESTTRGVNANEAWDDVNYVDLETDEDWIEKAQAIVAGIDYDTRVQVPLTLNDEDLFMLMKMAHEQDITLNQLVENVLREQIERLSYAQD